jgi:hypothetical protein
VCISGEIKDYEDLEECVRGENVSRSVERERERE